jgi:hypothetical protein
MTRTVTLFAILLLVGSGVQARQDVERPGPPATDDFETDSDNDGVPDGWYNLRDARLVDQGGTVGPKLIRFENSKPGRQARLSRAFGVDGRKTEALVIGLWVKGKDLRTGERLGEDAGLQIDFLGESLKSTGRGILGPFTAALGDKWVRMARRIEVPKGTRDAIMTVGLIGAIGTLEIDGLSIDQVPVGGAETSNLILNGNFELGNPAPPFWIIEEGAHRGFPGRQSTAALELAGAGAKALSGLGVRVDRLREIEVRLAVKGTGLRRGAGGARAVVYFRDADGRALPAPDDGKLLFRWSGTFDWTEERATVAIPSSAVRAVLQLETLDSTGSVKIDNVEVNSRAEGVTWNPYHVETGTDGWRELEPAPLIAKGSALDASTLVAAPAGKFGATMLKDGKLRFADGSPARFFGVVLLPPLAFPDRDTADALADRLSRSGVNLVRFDGMDSPYGPGQSLYDDSRDDTLALDPESMAKFDHLVAALKSRGIYVSIELLTVRRFREGDGIPGWLGLVPGGGASSAFDPMIRDRIIQAAAKLLERVNPETKLALKDDPVLAWVTIAGELSLLDRLDSDDPLPAEFETELKQTFLKQGTGRKAYANVESAQWKLIADALRKAGMKRPIAGSSHWRRDAEFVQAQTGTGLDLVDDRLFWAPPRFGAPERRSMLWKASATLASEANKKRKGDRPFVVGEWCAHTEGAWALPYEGADLLLASRISSADDWAAIVRRGVFQHPKIWGSAPAGTSGGPDSFAATEVLNANPQIFALLPHAAVLYYGGPREGTLQRTSTTMTWDSTRGRLTIDTAHCQGLAGWASHTKTKLATLSIEVDSPSYSVVIASSLSPKPLATTDRILVTTLGRAEPTGLLFADQWRREVASPGQGPILVEPVRAKVTVRRKGKLRAFALKPDGSRGAETRLAVTAEGATLEIDTRAAGLHWEIVVE